jgi:hypothetical protein
VSLSADDIYRLEIKVRFHAEHLRTAASQDGASSAPVDRAHVASLMRDADEFDQVGNLLTGLQGDWDRLGPMVRSGFIAMRAEFERRKRA